MIASESGSSRDGGTTTPSSAICLRVVWLLLLAVFLTSPIVAQSQKQKEEPPEGNSGATKLRIEVVAGEKDQPVENASVYVKFVRERKLARDKKIEMNTKTNRNGIATVPSVPRGKVLVQVIASGWKTFGQWYDLAKPEEIIKIKLQKPPRWY